MSSPSADGDAATKARIISHMNADHSDSLIRYLRHYRSVSSFSARNASLKGITLNDLTISCSSYPSQESDHTIPINPPLNSWADARARLAEMDGDACKGLGCSNITVKKYAPPKGFMAVVFGACVWTFLTFSRRSNFLPGSLYYDLLLKYVPWFASFCYKIQPLLITIMLALHSAEAIHLAITRLNKYTVPMFSRLWWQWIISDFIEGIGALIRFDQVVEEERSRKERQKH